MPTAFPIIGALTRPAECRGCPLDNLSTGFSNPDGTGRNGVLVLAEALGGHEAREGLPLRPNAPAGSVWARALRQLGVAPGDFAVFNTINCRPPNNELNGEWYEQQAIEHCRVHVNRIVERFKPRVILALGGVALRALTGLSGDKQGLDHLRGFALDSPHYHGVPVVATYHPSFIGRGAWNVFGAFMRDIGFALHIAKHGWSEPKLQYNEHATEWDLAHLYEYLMDTPEAPLSVDFETDGQDNIYEDEALSRAIDELYTENAKVRKKKQKRLGTKQSITQVNFSIEPGTALVTDFAGARREWAVRIIRDTPNLKVGHNIIGFDAEIAQHNDFYIGGPIDDTLLMFHHLYPDLPGKRGKMGGELDGSFANLQYCASFYGFPFPWKHEVKERPEWYGCCDGDSALRVYYGAKREMQALKARNGVSVWDGYCKLVYNIAPILKNMQDRGIPVNRTKMMEFLRMVVTEQRGVNEEIQTHIPLEWRPHKPKDGYARPPKDLTDCVQKEILLPAKDVRCKCFRVRKKNLDVWAEVPNAIYDDVKGVLRAPVPDCPVCGGAGLLRQDDRVEARYVRLAPFNVGSSPQMKFFARMNHHKIPKNSKGEFAMDKENLIKMYRKTQNEVYRLAVQYREYDKMAGTYALNWVNGGAETSLIDAVELAQLGIAKSTGFVHTTFTFFPATGQLSSVNPNVQTTPNVSKFGALAYGFRDAIEAPDGYVLMEADKKSYHAQTLGFEANCPAYIRLAKIDIHSYLATCMLKLPDHERALEWTDEELKAWLKWYRKNYHLADGTPFEKVRNGKAKPGILGYGFGLGANKLYALNEDSFNNRNEAQLVFDTLDRTFPEVAAFRETIPLVTKRQGNRLISLSGSIRWFWDIGHPKQGGGFEHGLDFEKAIAFLPATDAFGDMKAIMTRLEASGANKRYGCINQVHDSLVFCVRESLVEEAIYSVKLEMEKPSEVLLFGDGTGLQVDVEVKVGKTWANMKEVA